MAGDMIENGNIRKLELGLQENRDAVKSLEQRFDRYETDQKERNQQILTEVLRVDDHLMKEAVKREEANDRFSAEITALLSKQHVPATCPLSAITGDHETRLRGVEKTAVKVGTIAAIVGGAITAAATKLFGGSK